MIKDPIKFWCEQCERNSYLCGNCGLNTCSGGKNCEFCDMAYQAEQQMTIVEALEKPEQNQ